MYTTEESGPAIKFCILNKTTEKDTLARLATATPIASIKNKYKTNRDASEWDDIGHQTPRYNGSSVNTLNNPNLNNLTTAYAKKNNMLFSELTEMILFSILRVAAQPISFVKINKAHNAKGEKVKRHEG